MDSISALFLELIQVALGNRRELSKLPSEKEWKEVFLIAQKQSVVGVAFDALETLSSREQQIPKGVLFEWIALAEQIKRQNLVVNKRCIEITKLFKDAGFDTCILKGQGNARMYPNPLSRTSGDIDIWTFGERDEITKYVKDRTPNVFEQYHHIDFPIYKDVPVEVHYTPGKLLNPKYNKRFQIWCHDISIELRNEKLEVIDGYRVPSVDFNVVYQMSHILYHFFVEGIGLRHFIDYYYVLKLLDGSSKKEKVRETLCWLGLEKFAKGVMWIEKEVLGIDEQYLILEPDERIGKLILNEMMEGGNFGHHDERYKSRKKGMLARGITDTYRLIKLMPYFPDLVLWKIWNKIENQRWKIKSGSGLKKKN